MLYGRSLGPRSTQVIGTIGQLSYFILTKINFSWRVTRGEPAARELKTSPEQAIFAGFPAVLE
jgi:hypothetical protein